MPKSTVGQTYYSYDSLNRLDTVIEHNGEYRAYQYDELGNRVGKSFGIITPDSNYILKGNPEHCFNGKDGNIEINTKVFFRWDINIKGLDVNIDTTYSWDNHILDDPLRVGNLPPGDYEVCFTVGSYPESVFKECERVTVTKGIFTNAPYFTAINQGSFYDVFVESGNPPFNVYRNGNFVKRYETNNFSTLGYENDKFEVIDSCGHSARMRLQNGVVSVNDLNSEENQISIYPNPNIGELTININGVHSPYLEVEVYNAIGMKVFNETLEQSSTSQFNLNTHSLPSGTYSIRLVSLNTTMSFIKK